MKTIILTLISICMFLSCKKSDDGFKTQNITPILVYDGAFSSFVYNPTQHGIIITTQSDWDSFRNNYWIYGKQISEANAINFDAEMLLLAFDKPRTTTTGTLKVSFESIIENQENIAVHIKYSGEPGYGQSPSRICNFVKIPKSNKPIAFQ